MPPKKSQHEQKLAAIIEHGDAGKKLAHNLAAEGIRGRAGLRKVIDRLPKKAQANVLYAPVKRVPLETAAAIATELARRLRFGSAKKKVIIVGSVRREKPIIKDIDLLVVGTGEIFSDVKLASEPGATLKIVNAFAKGKQHSAFIVARDEGKHSRHYTVDLFAAKRADLPFALFHYTGNMMYNIRVRAHAKRQGWLLNQYGVFEAKSPSQRVQGSQLIKTERDLARFLGVTYRAPKNRGPQLKSKSE